MWKVFRLPGPALPVLMMACEVMKRPAQRHQKKAGIPEMNGIGIAEYPEYNPQGNIQDQQYRKKVQEENTALLVIHAIDLSK